MSNEDVIKGIRRSASSDAEALAQMFESSSVTDDGSVAGRLRAVLEATEHSVVPGLQTGIEFHQTGFRKEFIDPWPSSDNQVGHFLTAVGLSFNPGKVSESFAGRSLRDWLGADSALKDEQVALLLCIGHEKAADPGKGTMIGGGIVGALGGGVVVAWLGLAGVAGGAAGGAGVAILMAFRDQFAAATAGDVRFFLKAESRLGKAKALDLAAASGDLFNIAVDPSLRGNSREDLLLSCVGWRLGQAIKRGDFAGKSEVGSWIRTNIAA